jgi:hypothetical protein
VKYGMGIGLEERNEERKGGVRILKKRLERAS